MPFQKGHAPLYRGGNKHGRTKDPNNRKTGLLLKRLEKFMDDIFKTYDAEGGADVLAEIMKTKNGKAAMAKDMVQLLKKYFDYKISERKIDAGLVAQAAQSQHGGDVIGTQNFFIIKGLYDEQETKQVISIEPGKLLESIAPPRVAGLTE